MMSNDKLSLHEQAVKDVAEYLHPLVAADRAIASVRAYVGKPLSSIAYALEQRERVLQLESELKDVNDAYDAQIAKYEGCPHEIAVGSSCACSFDHISHVCAVHAPQLAKMNERVLALEKELDQLKGKQ